MPAVFGGTPTGNTDAPATVVPKAVFGGTPTGNTDAPATVVPKAVFGGTPTGNTDAPATVVPKPPVTDVSGGYVFNPFDFGGVFADQYEKSKQGIIASLGNGNESVTRNQSGVGGASFGGSSTNSNGIIGGQIADWGGTVTGVGGASFGGSSTNSNGIIGGQMQAAQVATPTQWNVTAPQTVQSQIKDIINPNSPIMQQARTGALEQMNSRGLANSSMAITAGDDAAYRAAIPIATADASTYAKSASYNADAQNQVNLANAQYANQAGQSNLSANTQTSIAKMNDDTQKQVSTLDAATRTNIAKMNDDTQKQLSTLDAATRTSIAKMNDDTQKQLSTLDAATRISIAKMNDDTQKQLSTLDVATRTNLQTLQNENQVLLNTNSQAASLFSNATSALNNITMSTTMDEAKKQDASAQVWSNLQTQIKVLSAISKLNLSSILGTSTNTTDNPYITREPTPEQLKDKTKPPGPDPDYEWSESAQSWVKKAAPAPAPAPSNNEEWLQT